MRLTSSVAVWLALLTACGSPVDPSRDAGEAMDARVAPDGGTGDAGGRDAGTPDGGAPDARAPADAGLRDGGPPDTDGDGVVDPEDCAPEDAAIGGESSRPCSTACGEGAEDCASGIWSACTAPTDCLCATPGERRVASCGMCGERSEECTDGVWSPVSSCLGEGACEPGAVERMEGTWCRVFERLCRTDCTWSDWSTVVPAGECTPPGSSDCDAYRMLDRLCTEDCRWVDDPDCPVNP